MKNQKTKTTKPSNKSSNRKMFDSPNRAALLLTDEQVEALVLVGWGNRSEGIRTMANFAGRFYAANFARFLEVCGIRNLENGTPLDECGIEHIKELRALTVANLKGIFRSRTTSLDNYDLVQHLVWIGEGVIEGRFTPEGVIFVKRQYDPNLVMMSPLFYRNKTVLSLL